MVLSSCCIRGPELPMFRSTLANYNLCPFLQLSVATLSAHQTQPLRDTGVWPSYQTSVRVTHPCTGFYCLVVPVFMQIVRLQEQRQIFYECRATVWEMAALYLSILGNLCSCVDSLSHRAKASRQCQTRLAVVRDCFSSDSFSLSGFVLNYLTAC